MSVPIHVIDTLGTPSSFAKALLSLTCLLTCAMGIRVFSCHAQNRDPLDRPNVVLIFVDDSGYGDYAHNGNPVIETPSISRLANQGANFTQFYVTSPACSASRYSLLTGRYPARSGLGTWVVGPNAATHLRLSETTIAEGLKSKGYATAMFGKWHLGNPNQRNNMTSAALPLAHGFDLWIGTNVSHDYDDAKLLASDPAGNDPIPGYRMLADRLPSNPHASASLTGRYIDGAEAFIRSNKDHPFFLYVAPNQPHLGLYVTEPFAGKSRRGLLGDVMLELDEGISRIVGTLEQCQIAENTIIIYTSDNGPWIRFQDTADHPKYGEARMHVGYAQPFRDGKGSNWEGGHRVPGIMYWPGTISPLRQLEPASTLDILPTLFALCGVTEHLDVDGRDIRPLLAPDRFSGEIPPFTFAFSGSNNLPNAYREGPWKIHWRIFSQTGNDYGFTPSREQPLLFQVEQDIGEGIDRADEHPEIVTELSKNLKALIESFRE